jgi:diguanylate cyclase (GGDEF)-like protein
VFTDRVEVARRGGRGFVPKTLAPRQIVDQVMQAIERTSAAETTLLAVDDDPALLDAIRALLEPHGLRVSTLADPLRFWQELERVRPDLLLLDLEMPEVGGIELCRVVRNDPRWATTPVVVLTSQRDRETVRAVFAAGADDYLLKPVIGEELVGRIANRLDRLQLHRFLTDRDALTGVHNRRSSTEGLERLLRLARRYEQPLTVAVIDLDRFKDVNDRRGHVAGDTVLRRLGELLSGAFRGEDVVGRWGGEEFVVGMYGMARADALRRLRDLLAALGREEFRGKDDRPFRVGFSAGVAQHPGDGGEVADLYRAADAALYRAKAAGRGRVMAAGEEAGAELDVLLVEDDDALADLVLDGLGQRGYRVRRIGDGAEAAAALAGAEPSLDPRIVLLDLELPGLDGFEVLRRLVADGALGRLRVIVLTGRAAEQDQLRSLELGAYDYVTKPLSVPVLMHKVALALEGSVGPGKRE